ncbi:hypothetical protein HNQ59_003439 [Chitinivorax tropicus]|uniref:Uncharacterized protein n=1 Tax=Chitinivorax tropicus TaxID=714531 RepID=A0A840MRS4_9PROT|nr:hypothetical protein [Chitinivorax tropicus]MBB5020125.1 hypothetical protein [Chitinivorax tropicus]
MKKPLHSDILVYLNRADLVQFNDELVRPDYIMIPDDDSRRDDIVLECTVNGQSVDFTVEDLANAENLGDGGYLVKHRGVVRFLQVTSIH